MVLGATSTLGSADLEAVLEASVDDLKVSHSAAASGLSSLGLLAPVDCFEKIGKQASSNSGPKYGICSIGKGIRTLASLSGGIAAAGASLLLDMKRALSCIRKPQSSAQFVYFPLHIPSAFFRPPASL